jgi:hypothetical protein
MRKSKSMWNVVLILMCVLFSTSYSYGSPTRINVPKNTGTNILFDMKWDKFVNDPKLLKAAVIYLGGFDSNEESERIEISHVILRNMNAKNDGILFLEVNEGCSSDPRMIISVYNIHENIFAYLFDTERGRIDEDIKDMDKDGDIEVIVRESIVSGPTHSSEVYWSDIYEFKDDKFVLSNNEFINYYNDIQNQYESYRDKLSLQNIKQLSLSIPNTKDSDLLTWKKHQLSMYEFYIDRIKRLKGDKIAGFEKAKEWASMDDFVMVNNAIEVFKEIGNDESKIHLEKMTKNKDEYISTRSKAALRQIEKSR